MLEHEACREVMSTWDATTSVELCYFDERKTECLELQRSSCRPGRNAQGAEPIDAAKLGQDPSRFVCEPGTLGRTMIQGTLYASEARTIGHQGNSWGVKGDEPQRGIRGRIYP
jgi:hypothetical protein